MGRARRQGESTPAESTQDRSLVDATGQARDQGALRHPYMNSPGTHRRVIGRWAFFGRPARDGDSQTGSVREDEKAWSDGKPLAGTADQQRGSNADHGSADLAARLGEMGLTHKVAWFAGAMLYGGGGLLVTGLYTISPALVPRGVFYLGCIAIVIGALCVFAGQRLRDSNRILEWAMHARLIIGLAIFVTATSILQDKGVAFALVPLLIVPTACYLYTWRLALPYVVAGALIVCVALLLVDGPARVAHALISTCAFVVIAAAMIVTKQRTRLLARHNRQLAYTDPLTGIANMRSLRERISADLGRPSGDGQPFALFALDLDNFKQVNDRFDHSMGDRVLRAVAAALCNELELGDLAVRRGGDEFALLVPNPGERDLGELRERLESAIARARTATCPQVTPSGTVAYVRIRPGEEIGTMMERADQALHDAKVDSRERRRGQAPQFADPRGAVEADFATARSGVEERSEGPADEAQIERAQPARPLLRAITDALGRSNPDWRFAALLFALGAVVIASVSVTQMVEPLTPLTGTGMAAGSVALALTCVWAGISGLSQKWLHLAWVAAYGLLALEITLAGRSGTALLDLIPAIVTYGFLLFTARTAVLYLILGQGLYGAFAVGEGFAQGVARTVITTVVVAAVAGLFAKLRLVTVGFARRNRELSELDALTGVANLRALRGRVIDAVGRASSQQLHPLIVAIDLDEFKQVNDVHSHSTGDRVLIAVARTMTERVRIDELVARRGGDEFAVVIDDADPEYADALVARIDEAIVRARRRICPDLRSTASIVSVPWRPGETPDDLLHEADLALHERKARSRPRPRLVMTA
jgi:diguanylate cyclase (GGDEF)-like protein